MVTVIDHLAVKLPFINKFAIILYHVSLWFSRVFCNFCKKLPSKTCGFPLTKPSVACII